MFICSNTYKKDGQEILCHRQAIAYVPTYDGAHNLCVACIELFRKEYPKAPIVYYSRETLRRIEK